MFGFGNVENESQINCVLVLPNILMTTNMMTTTSMIILVMMTMMILMIIIMFIDVGIALMVMATRYL